MVKDWANFNPADVLSEAEGQFARRMLNIYRTFNALAQQKYAERGYIGLTPAHVSLLAHLEPHGIRIVDLAARLGLTKQFASRLVQELAKIGYVTQAADPTDRRATLINGTPDGWQFLLDACEVRVEIESTFQSALGDTLYSAFAQAIEKLASLGVETTGAEEPIESISE